MTTHLPRGLFGPAIVAVLAIVAMLAGPVEESAAGEVPEGFSEDVVFSDLAAPTAVRFAADGKIFVAEKGGLVKVFDGLADATPTVSANLEGEVYPEFDRGLLGLEVDPDFPAQPYVYVLYTHNRNPLTGNPWVNGECPTPPGPTTDGCVVTGRLSRFEVDPGTGVMTGAEDVLIDTEWCQQFPSHSMGALASGPDGMLYASAGEGANFEQTDYGQFGGELGGQPNPCGDPPGGVGADLEPPTAEGGALRSQDLRTGGDPTGLSGSIIRVNPESGLSAPGNPITDPGDENAERIVAHGLRNPFRFTVRPSSTGAGELWIADVGWTEYEEIDVLADPTDGPVKNYGWPCYEGRDDEVSERQPDFDFQNLNICEDLYDEEDDGEQPVEPPHYAFGREGEVVPGDNCTEANGAVLSGIDFAEGGDYPTKYNGALFFGDYARGCIWTMLADESGEPDPENVETFVDGAAPGEEAPPQPVDIQVGPGGDLFYADYGFDNPDGGTIRRIRYLAPTAVATASPQFGPLDPDLQVNFDGTDSTEIDGTDDDLTYDWDLDGDGAFNDATTPTATRTYDVAENVTVRLRVTDTNEDLSDVSDPITISPGNLAPPQVTIDQPTNGSRWRVGGEVPFSGQATDLNDETGDPGELPSEELEWSVSIEHCPNGPTGCHVHPFEDSLQGSGSIVGPDHEYPSGLIFRATATDDRGLKTTATRKIDAQLAELRFRSAPISGVPITVDTQTRQTPFTRRVVAGSPQTVDAPTSVVGSPTHVFDSWSDGGARVHDIIPTAGTRTYTATYRPTGAAPGEPPSPDATVELGKGKRNTKRGTAKLEVEISGPGRLDLAGKRVKPASKDVEEAGTVKMPVKPTSKAKRKLAKTGKAKVAVEVTFTPIEGEPATDTGKLKLVRRR